MHILIKYDVNSFINLVYVKQKKCKYIMGMQKCLLHLVLFNPHLVFNC